MEMKQLNLKSVGDSSKVPLGVEINRPIGHFLKIIF